jgi:hypothetical protein
MKSKQVTFIPGTKDSQLLVESPKPSKRYLPTWFKDMPQEKINIYNNGTDKTAKLCMPFVDSLSYGYIQELPCDLKIINNGVDDDGNDIISYRWFGAVQPCSTRREEFGSQNMLPSFDGYYTSEFHWITNWEPKTPNGYSTMYHHPSNRFDLPFHTLTGIIDTDNWSISGPLPFLIKKGFEGIIPAGTPIYQITFVKRENWVSDKAEYDEDFQKKHFHNVKKLMSGGYKKFYWNRKSFE